MQYYNVNRLLNEKSMPICVAKLKHGYQNFSLTILEFCDLNSLISKEKHFFEVYSPVRESGWKHSEATIESIRVLAKRMESPEILAKLSAAQSSSIGVEVTDIKTNTSTSYHAIKAAARALGIDRRHIKHYIYLKQDKPVFDRYIFKLLNTEGEITNSIVEKVQKTSKKVEVTNVETKEITMYSSVGAALLKHIYFLHRILRLFIIIRIKYKLSAIF